MSSFPKTPAFTGFNEPMRFEADLVDLETEGAFPAEIHGAYYHVRPDPHFPPKLGDDIYFGGDGAVSMFRIRNGRVDFKHRYVRTDKFVLENEAGRALFGAYRNPLTDDPSVKGRYRGTANTTVIEHAGKLFALKEDSPAVLMDPVTLDTSGYTDFGGRMKSQTFTAHPKIDPETGQMIAFGYAAKGLCTPWVHYMEISPQGELTKELEIEVPYYGMIHDFIVTEKYVVIPCFPFIGSWERLERGLPHFGSDSSLPVYLGVLPRDGEAKDVRWLKGPACYNGHVVNAWNDKEKIYIDLPISAENGYPFFPDVTGKPFNPEASVPIMSRWTIDLAGKSETWDRQPGVAPIPGELPRIDDRYQTRPHRYAWYGTADMSQPVDIPGGPEAAGLFMVNTLVFFDFAIGRPATYWSGKSSVLQECQFIPRRQGAEEGDGWIVALVNHFPDRRTDLLVFEAMAIEQGPIARAKLPFLLRPGVHGCWTDGRKLAG